MSDSDRKYKWLAIAVYIFAAAWLGTVVFVAQHFIRKYW